MGWLPPWGIVTQPLAFVLFLTAGIAATKRIPFDTPEGESEIIGYFVEYSGMKFGMFLMADFVETVVIAGHDHRAVPGRLAGALPAGRRLPSPVGGLPAPAAPRGDAAAGRVRSSLKVAVMIFIPHAHPLDAAALPVRSGHAPGLARPVPALRSSTSCCTGAPCLPARWGALHEARTALLPARGAQRARADRRPLLPQHGQAHRSRVRPEGRPRRGDHPVPGRAPALLAAPALAAPSGAPRATARRAAWPA